MSKVPAPEKDPLVGGQLANFRVDGVIKRGGMAQVYYGWDVMLHRPVAIKVIDARFRSNVSYAERFVREARAVAAWRHENIIQIYHADTEGGLYYFVMEYIDGLDLGELADQYAEMGELMPHEDVLRIGRSVAQALDYAHQHGVIHRDVKPSNVLVSVDGRILLTDFGLAMMVDEGSSGEVLGTPHYVAPEQAMRSANAVPQSDLYSLTVMLYELLTGKLPFDDESITSLALQHVTQEPPAPRSINPHLGQEVEKVLLKGLSKSPEARHRSAGELLADLEKALSLGQPVPGGWMALPPLPATANGNPDIPRLSQTSVVEKIALQLEQEEREGKVSGKRPTLPKRVAGRRVWMGRVWSLLILAIVIIVLIWTAIQVKEEVQDNPVLAFMSTATPTLTIAPTATTLPPTATATVTPVSTDTPTSTPTPVPPTATPTATPSITPSRTPTPSVTPTPTLVFTGPALRFFYDPFSFYLWNQSDVSVGAGSLTFEALDENGRSAGFSFQGRSWAEIYANIETKKCVNIELNVAVSIFEPLECEGLNASVVLARNDERVFWVPREGVAMFRVFWSGQEIGRCPIVTGICDVRLP